MLTDVAIPTSTGFDTVKDNLGKVRNRGIEAKLSYTLWQGKQGFFNLFARSPITRTSSSTSPKASRPTTKR